MITLEKTKSQDIPRMDPMWIASFDTNRVYFPGGILPPPPVEETISDQCREPGYTLLSILEDGDLIGGSLVKKTGEGHYLVDRFFLREDSLGKGIGAQALAMVEDFFPEAEVWELHTPVQILKNVAFYVNKCGYRIVEVRFQDREAGNGLYVFQKEKKRPGGTGS